MDVSSASSFASKHRSEMPDGETGRCRRTETLFLVLESKKCDIRCTEEKGKGRAETLPGDMWHPRACRYRSKLEEFSGVKTILVSGCVLDLSTSPCLPNSERNTN